MKRTRRSNAPTPAPQHGQPPARWRPVGGLELTNLHDAWRFASAVIKSGLAPHGLDSPEKVLIAMQLGAELGLPPLSALQNISVIRGRPYLSADAMLAVCRASGLFDEAAFVERIEYRDSVPVAICQVRRLPDGKPVVREFSLVDAKRAGLIRKDSAWEAYPLRMLQLRARSWALRDTFSDVLRGLRPAEDVDDTVEVVADTPEPADTSDTTEALAALARAVAEAEPEPEQEPPQQEAPEPDEAEQVDDEEFALEK